MSLFLILLGGDLTVTDRLRQQIAGARVLAADGGIRHARALGVEPELWLGDFDSTSAELLADYAHVPRRTFPRAKDMTDGELALTEAFLLGATRVILCGAFGGERTDHTMLHLTMATALAMQGRELMLSSGVEEAWPLVASPPASSPGKSLVPREYVYDLPQDALFSILCFAPLEGLFITGAEWPLNNVRLSFGSSLTLSNVVKGTLRVVLRSGYAVLLAKPYGEKA